MRTLERELQRTADEIRESANKLAHRDWTQRDSRRVSRFLTPIVTALVVLVVLAAPALLRGDGEAPTDSTPVPVDSPSDSTPAPTEIQPAPPHGDSRGERPDPEVVGRIPHIPGQWMIVTIGVPGHERTAVFYTYGQESVDGVVTYPLSVEVSPTQAAAPRDPSTGEPVMVYETGKITIRGGREATLYNKLDTGLLFAIHWTETPGVHVWVVSEVLDVVGVAESLLWMDPDDPAHWQRIPGVRHVPD